MRRLLAVVALIAVLGGGAIWLQGRGDGEARGSSASPSRDRPRPEAFRGCRTHIEGRLPPADRRKDFIAGPVRFRGFRAYSRFAAREPRRDFFEIPGGHYRGLKFVTEVRAGADVTVAIGPASRDSAGLLFDLNGRSGPSGIRLRWSQRAVRFRACPADRSASNPRFYRRATVGPWTQFNGGFLFTRPQCLRLDVYVRGRAPRRFVEPFARSRNGCPTP
jgi:hypothetical protein